MRGSSSSRAAPAVATSAVMLAQLAAIRYLFSADTEHVRFLGRPFELACAWRERFGLPCPSCGITRGVVLTLQGDFLRAWRLFPAAPLGVAGFVALSLALLALASAELQGRPAAAFKRWLPRVCLSYAGVAALVWLTGWVGALQRLSSNR